MQLLIQLCIGNLLLVDFLSEAVNLSGPIGTMPCYLT